MCFVLNLRMSGENCLIFNWHCSRAVPGISFSRMPTKDDEYSISCRNNFAAVIGSWSGRQFKKQIKNRTFWVALSSRKKWSVASKLFPPNYTFIYISNWANVLEFYLMSFFNMKSWSVKFGNFLDDFRVHYAALFINRTIITNIWLY